jgi:hypothetical protein
MIPNTFEAVLLSGKVDWLGYTGGYVFSIKTRNEDSFNNMSEQAGAVGSDQGVVLVGLRATPWKPLAVDLSTAWGLDTFNTALAQVEYAVPLAKDVALSVGAQYHDQRSVGDELLGAFDTWNVGAHARLALRGAAADFMFHQTGDGASIRSPWGTWPGYLSLINLDFNRADETAWGVRLSYDFAGIGIPGLTAFFWYGEGRGAIDPSTRASAPDRREYDFDVTYTIPGGALRGLQIKARAALIDLEGTPGLLPDVRIILNFPLRLL